MTLSPLEYEEQLTAGLASWFQHTWSQSRQGSHCIVQELLGQVFLGNLTDLDSAAVPLQLKENPLLANLFIRGCLEEKLTGPLVSTVLEDNSSGRVLLADLGHMREHFEAKKVQIYQITQFSSYSKYRYEFYVANKKKLRTDYKVTTIST